MWQSQDGLPYDLKYEIRVDGNTQISKTKVKNCKAFSNKQFKVNVEPFTVSKGSKINIMASISRKDQNVNTYGIDSDSPSDDLFKIKNGKELLTGTNNNNTNKTNGQFGEIYYSLFSGDFSFWFNKDKT